MILKRPISINNININKIVVSNKLPFDKPDFEYFISYKDDKKIIPLCIFCPKIVYNEEILIKLNVYIFW